jgi:uncharacterized repeat protein (TIGR03803 family)
MFITLFVSMGLLLTASAQTANVLVNFDRANGANPVGSLTPDGAGNYYGTTYGGGTNGWGTVFELSPSVGGGWTETILYSFTGGADGGSPGFAVVRDAAGNLYGSTTFFGSLNHGMVFELSPLSGGGWTESVLYTFTGGADGGAPNGLVIDPAGNLYGTTNVGGNSLNDGVVFELSPSASGWTESTIYTFYAVHPLGDTSANGALTLDAAGNLYGTTSYNGTRGNGVVFKLSPNGSGGWTARVLHNFSGFGDGGSPNGNLVLDAAGNIFGTTPTGGDKTACNRHGCGVVFELSPTMAGGWKYTGLYAFTGGTDGGVPYAGLVIDSSGNLYGTTNQGGPSTGTGCSSGCGVVFEFSPGSSGYSETILYSLTTTTGAGPSAPLSRDSSGNLFGTTFYGGTDNIGTVFEVTP